MKKKTSGFRPAFVGFAALALIAAPLGANAIAQNPPNPNAPDQTAPAPSATQPATPGAPSDQVPAAGDQTAQPSPNATPGAASPTQTGAAAPASGGAPRQPRPIAETGNDWPAYGGTIHATRYSPLGQINRDNVAKLKKIWEFRSGDMPDEHTKGKYSPENTPIKAGGSLYTCSAMDIISALDPLTGKEEWRYDPNVPDDAIPYGATCRGVAYYEQPDAPEGALCKTRIIFGTLDARLIAVDAKLGQPCTGFGENGEVSLNEGLGKTVPGWVSVTSPPTIVRGIAVVGQQVKDGQAEDAPSGVIRGYDAVTGKLAWAWDMGRPGQKGLPPEGQTYTRGTPNMWTTAAGDEQLGYVYVPLGNSSVDYFGGNRSKTENEFSSSVVAIDVTTGDPVWHFQTVHYDLWDYDLGSQPTLVDFPTNKGTVPALILPSKQGEIFVLNRKTGKPIVPVEERNVPKGGVETAHVSPTQPHSTYHSLMKPPLRESDMWGMSPLDQLWCRIQYHRANYNGPYTPPSANGPWIEYPGYNGGSDWGGVAVDTKRGILIANYNDIPNLNRLIPRKQADQEHISAINSPGGISGSEEGDAQAGSPYAINVNAGWRVPLTGLICKQPPYGGIRAIDLKTGKTLWDKPLGEALNNGPFGIPSMLPITIGTPNNGGPIITAGGLVFIAAATDDLLRAIDIETGKVVWKTALPAGGQATPMTYEAGGKQFIVIAPGGHHFMNTKVGDYVIAYGLPQDVAQK